MEPIEKTALILHGHFYQPPRENPLTGIIPKQPSAKPFPDWNEHIFSQCYAANTNSRYLDGNGRILSITNNFEYISYNFGPTLLTWIKANHPGTYEKIIEADRSSILRLGHGNAMAQGFNHTILPLDSPRAARHQILWGLEDFSSRFGREAEGMWLPEAAINPDIIDLLVASGIKFVILSPWQCKSIETEPGKMVDLEGKPAPYDKPYILTGTKGNTISAFFYNPQLADGISFGHLLRDADNLYQTLETIKQQDGPALIHTATDGEIYGHHEPFGDMALAALIRKVNEREDFTFTNYATFLEGHPAVLHAQLHPGEENKGTSWSCSHGVSRWYKDCGCHTGGEEGWNQKWRTPLRDALQHNADRLVTIFDTRVGEIFDGQLPPDRLLDLYGEVAGQALSMEDFLSGLATDYPQAQDNRAELASLLEGIKNKHFSFTSCGWFFNDLAGLEPKQNIAYALYAISLFQRFSQTSLLSPFLRELKQAKCNRKIDGDGMVIAQEELNALPGEVEATLFFILNRRIAEPQFITATYGRFKLLSYSYGDDFPELELYDTISLRDFNISTIIGEGEEYSSFEFYIAVKDKADNHVMRYSVNNSNIPPRMLDQAYTWIEHSLSIVGDDELMQIARDIDHYSMLSKNSKYLPMATLFIENIGTCLRALRSLFITPNTLPWDKKEESIHQLIGFIKKQGRRSEIETINGIFTEEINRLALQVQENGLDKSNVTYLIGFLALTKNEQLDIDMKNLQNSCYPFVTGKNPLPDECKDDFAQLKTLLDFA
jgi:hypothetical protein